MRTEDFKKRWLPLSGQFYRVAFYMLEDESDAHDVVQDLYIKLWTARGGKEDIINPLAYGIRILKNLCIDRIRKKSSSTVELPESLEDNTVSSYPDPERSLIDRDRLKEAEKYIGRLPEKQRNALEMRILQDMEYADIAEVTGMSEQAVRTNLSLARKSLRKMMEEEK